MVVTKRSCIGEDWGLDCSMHVAVTASELIFLCLVPNCLNQMLGPLNE